MYGRKKPSFNDNRRRRRLLLLLQQLSNSTPSSSLPQLHAQTIKVGHSEDTFLLTRLAHAYVKSNALDAANFLFSDFTEDPPLFLWNEMIKGYSRNRLFKESIHLYRLMLARGIRPNEFTFTFVLPACAGAQSVSDGRKIHDHVVKTGHGMNAFVVTALVDMYAKCGEVGLSRKVFDGSPTGTSIFNAMISGYTANGQHNEAMDVFDSMHRLGIPLDGMTVVSALQVCASLGALQRGTLIHDHITRNSMEMNVYMGAALVNMYARCGCMERSLQVFNELPHRDLVCWTTAICGCGMHGLAGDAESLFARMVDSGIEPDSVAFVGLLAGFSHRGLVDKGRSYFDRMVEEYRIKPTLEHYSCMVDMLARVGKLDEAEKLVKTMVEVEPDSGILGSLLNACKIHGNVEVGERVVKQILTIDSENAGWYVLMSNIYATAKRWDGVAKMRLLMRERNVVKPPGWSSIEIKGRVHRFLVFDQSHPQSDEIYGVMKELEDKIRLEGYVAETKCVLGNLPEDAKEDMLCGHSERLAIAFGILSTEEGDTLRIIKNLRVCVDCHTATKYISRITRREIIVRDAKRFHHFKNGFCSCADYW